MTVATHALRGLMASREGSCGERQTSFRSWANSGAKCASISEARTSVWRAASSLSSGRGLIWLVRLSRYSSTSSGLTSPRLAMSSMLPTPAMMPVNARCAASAGIGV